MRDSAIDLLAATCVRAARGSGVLAFALSAALFGQTANPRPATDPEPEPPQQLERFVVTGSYIPSAETAVEAGASPVVRIDRQLIDESGYTTTAELVQQITVSNANAVPVSNNATGFTPGATAISLRGLGPEATLVLINGRRVAPYPVGAGGSTAFVDLNSIPLAAIDSIEVLKDGASAIYGADAVAGVINIKLRRGVDGSEAFLSYGNTTNEDSAEFVANFVSGASKDKLSFLVGANYYRKGAIMYRDRDYSAVAPFLSANSSPANLEVSRFAVSAALGQTVTASIPGVPNNVAFFFAHSGAELANDGARPAAQYTYSLDRSSTFNFNEFAMSYPKNERKGAFASGELKLLGTDHLKAYADLSYQKTAFENQLAPTATGDFSTPGRSEIVIPARTANPILTLVVPSLGRVFAVPAGTVAPAGSFPGPGSQILNGTVQRLAAPGATNPFNPFNQDIADGSRARLAEFGNRVTRNQTAAFLFAGGIKGENVAGKWNFDASVGYSSIRDHTRSTLVSATRLNEILNAGSPIFNASHGAYVGSSTPYNPFGYYRTPIASNGDLVDYARRTTNDVNEAALGQLSFVGSTSELLALPKGSLGVAFGGDFRREELQQGWDPLSTSGDLIGESPKAITNAQRKIGGVFLEARVPLLRNLEINASVRHEKFFTSHRDTTVPKISVRYQPFRNQLTLRSSYSEGFREPSLFELYSSPISVLAPIQDPRTGVVEPELPVTFRGNRRLTPEKTDYFNVGFVWSPTTPRLKGLSLGVDHWKITREGTVQATPQDTVYRAFGALPGGLMPEESVFLSATGSISLVNSVFVNAGQTEVDGWDFSGGYQWPTDAFGRWELTTVWTLLTNFERSAVPGAPLTDVLGGDSTGTGDNGYLEWKGRVNLRWAFKGFTVALIGSYTDGFEDRDLNRAPFRVADSFHVHAQLAYSFRGVRRPMLRDTKISLGVRNLFDRDPPRALGGGGNSAGYPGHLYTSENRFWYVTVGRKF